MTCSTAAEREATGRLCLLRGLRIGDDYRVQARATIVDGRDAGEVGRRVFRRTGPRRSRLNNGCEGDTSDKSNTVCHPSQNAHFRGFAYPRATQGWSRKNKILFRHRDTILRTLGQANGLAIGFGHGAD